MTPVPHAARLAALAAACLLAGCASMDGIAPQAHPLEPAPAAAASVDITSVQPQWWREFGDARLDALVDEALQGNPNLGVAQAAARAWHQRTAIAARSQ